MTNLPVKYYRAGDLVSMKIVSVAAGGPTQSEYVAAWQQMQERGASVTPKQATP